MTLIGVLGRDPEMRFTAAGDAVAAFSVSTARDWVSAAGEQQRATDWFNVFAWHRLAELSRERLHEGSVVFVEGRLQSRSWTDESGTAQQRIEIVASQIVPLADGGGPTSDTGSPGEGDSEPDSRA